ncbi:MAG: RNA methyltransferase [bacterium]|nr:RNA methyltransferase [bacterium]
MSDHLDRIVIVLNRPIHPGNVGSVARAMKNMGLGNLRIVGGCDLTDDRARWMAVAAKEILDRTVVFQDLKEGVADCGLVIGTVPPDRPRFQQETYPAREMARRLRCRHPDDPVAILFGPEDNGLSNRELDLCHEFVSIPSHPAYPSLNISHAVMVIAYEIYMAAEEDTSYSERPAAPVEQVEQMYLHLEYTLLKIGFLDPHNPLHIMRDLRRIFSRARLGEREVKIIRGMCRQIDWAAGSRKR